MIQQHVLDAILFRAVNAGDRPVRAIAVGSHLAGVASRSLGLASFLTGCSSDLNGAAAPGLALDLAPGLRGQGTAKATLGMAAVNSLLPVPDVPRRKAQDAILEKGRGRRVAVVGHFPFVEKIGPSFAAFHVLELRPGPGDTPAANADEVLPLADVVALTSTTLLNGTFAALMNLIRPEAYVALLGPSTPMCLELFDFGVNALAGALVVDEELALKGIRSGVPFRGLKGVEAVYWEASGHGA